MNRSLSAFSQLRFRGEPSLEVPIGTWRNLSDLFLEGELELFCECSVLINGIGHLPQVSLESKDAVFGCAVDLPGPFEAGRVYRIEPTSKPDTNSPDLVYADGVLAWSRAESGDSATFHVRARNRRRIRLEFVKARSLNPAPDREIDTGRYRTMHLGFDIHYVECRGKPSRPTLSFVLPRDLRRWRPAPIYRQADHYRPVPWNKPPIQQPDYPTDRVVVFGYHETISSVSKDTQLQRQLYELYAANGVNAVHGTWHLPIQEEAGGTPRMQTCFVGVPLVDREKGGPADVEPTIATVNEITERYPWLQVVLRASEPDTCQQWYFLTSGEKRLVEQLRGANLRKVRDMMTEECRSLLDGLRRRLKHPERVKVLFQMAGLNGQGSDWYRYGADIVLTKTIHRQCLNVVVATGRGAALPYDRPFALEYDSWNGPYYHQNGAIEPEFILFSMFFAGADYIDNEYAHVGVWDGKVLANGGGTHYLALGRFAARHPRRGRPRVNTAFMRGSGDMWFRPTAVGGNGHPVRYTQDGKQDDIWRCADWSVLDVVFPHFGNTWESNFRRTGTGTPYGMADIIPWDAPLEGLCRYKVVVLMGVNYFSKQTYENLKAYVRQGGQLVLCLNQLRATDGYASWYFRHDVRDLAGVELGEDLPLLPVSFSDQIPHKMTFYNAVRLAGAKVRKRLECGAPYLTTFSIGKGRVHFFATEFYTTVEGQTIRELLAELFEPLREVTLDPGSDWLETFVSERDGILLLTLMNHAQARYPSDLGAEAGPWRGKVCLDLARLGLRRPLEAVRVDREMGLRRVPSACRAARSGGRERPVLEFRAVVDRWQEFVIGPKGQVETLFFRG
jgi:hypothetical protein